LIEQVGDVQGVYSAEGVSSLRVLAPRASAGLVSLRHWDFGETVAALAAERHDVSWNYLMRMQFRVAVLALIVGFVAACDQVLVRQPARVDLAGVYTLTSGAREFLINEKGYPRALTEATIELRSDGHIVLSNVPDCAVDGFGEPRGRFLTGRGTWTVEKASLGYDLTLDIAAGDSVPPSRYLGWVVIRRRSPPYELEMMVGDPDSGERIRYHRQSS
jgi:hypothetical protein